MVLSQIAAKRAGSASTTSMSGIPGTRQHQYGSTNTAARIRQHFDFPGKHLSTIRVIVDETFDKSVCLDPESFLIRLLAGDGTYRVVNRNGEITEADYYDGDL